MILLTVIAVEIVTAFGTEGIVVTVVRIMKIFTKSFHFNLFLTALKKARS